MTLWVLMALLAAPPAAPKTKAPDWSPADPRPALLARLQQQLAALEYRDADALSAALLAREDLTLDERIDTQLARGRVLAIIADPTDAEPMFRLVLRARPAFDLPDDTPPRVLAVFRKVQVEERRAADQLRAVERARRIAGLALRYREPTEVRGGQPLLVELRLRDDTGAAERLRMGWRVGTGEFATLPLSRRPDGAWAGTLSASDTVNQQGAKLDYFFEVADPAGVLLSDGNAGKPHQLTLLPGQVKVTPPISSRAFALIAGGTGVLAIASGVLWLVVGLEARAFHAPQTVTTEQFLAAQSEGKALSAVAVTVSVTALVGLVATLVSAPLTDFGGPQVQDSPFAAP